MLKTKTVSNEQRIPNGPKARGFIRIRGPGVIFEKQTCAIDDKSFGSWSLAHFVRLGMVPQNCCGTNFLLDAVASHGNSGSPVFSLSPKRRDIHRNG
jgi:hypothetical protein